MGKGGGSYRCVRVNVLSINNNTNRFCFCHLNGIYCDNDGRQLV